MSSIRDTYRTEIEIAIADSVIQTSPAFLAALIANETGGDPSKKRFEKNVLLQLWEVIQGRAVHFGSLIDVDIENFCVGQATTARDPLGMSARWFPEGCRALDSLATSWGLTQIMGYEAIALGVPIGALAAPGPGLLVTCRMLKQFAKGAGLDVSKDFSELFDCWNSGRPHAPTADPSYIPNGLTRMATYDSLQPPPQVMSA